MENYLREAQGPSVPRVSPDVVVPVLTFIGIFTILSLARPPFVMKMHSDGTRSINLFRVIIFALLAATAVGGAGHFY